MSDYNYRSSKPGTVVKMWNKGVPISEDTISQVTQAAELPFIHKWVALMPDAHKGIGSSVGAVIPTHKAIIPAAVGVDIGCGMVAIETDLTSQDVPDNVSTWRFGIEAAIPVGFSAGKETGNHENIPKDVGFTWLKELKQQYDLIIDLDPKIKGKNLVNQLGTLGSGNHFIELCLDERDIVWIVLHSGSRGVGNRIGSYFITMAKKEMERYFISLPDKDLSYLVEGTTHFDRYVYAMNWAQRFAKFNRDLMANHVIEALARIGIPLCKLKPNRVAINCHHNYVTKEQHYNKNVWVTRKGAVCAREGVLGIIPGSMGAKSFIVEGKGHPESFNSCSHGAGRVMSRTQARKEITLEEHLTDTKGVECRKDMEVIDESPKAYKNIDDVMKAQKSLVNIKHTLKQFLCVKG